MKIFFKSAATVRLALFVGAAVLIDQASKWFALTKIPAHVTHNEGVAFSINLPEWAVGVVFILAITFVSVTWARRGEAWRRLHALPFGLMTGGALSNVIDRVARGGVVDFIDLKFWPSFNVADTALSVGAVILIWYSFRTPTTTSHASHAFGPHAARRSNSIDRRNT